MLSHEDKDCHLFKPLGLKAANMKQSTLLELELPPQPPKNNHQTQLRHGEQRTRSAFPTRERGEAYREKRRRSRSPSRHSVDKGFSYKTPNQKGQSYPRYPNARNVKNTTRWERKKGKSPAGTSSKGTGDNSIRGNPSTPVQYSQVRISSPPPRRALNRLTREDHHEGRTPTLERLSGTPNTQTRISALERISSPSGRRNNSPNFKLTSANLVRKKQTKKVKPSPKRRNKGETSQENQPSTNVFPA